MAGTVRRTTARPTRCLLAVLLLAPLLVAVPFVARPAAAEGPGQIDGTYGDAGVSAVPEVFGSDDRANAAAVDDLRRIVTVGSTRRDGRKDILVTRHLEDDGAFDPAFDDDGRATYDAGTGSEEATDVVIDSAGRIVVVGRTSDDASSHFIVLRFLADGSLDGSFGGTGVVFVSFDGFGDRASDVAIASDGDLVVSGTVGSSDGPRLGLVRLEGDGSRAAGFGDAVGRAVVDFGPDPVVSGLAIDGGGRILVGATLPGAVDNDFAVVRLLVNGSPDVEFGAGGTSLVAVGAGDDTVAGLVVQPTGEILVGGTAVGPGGSDTDFAVIRLLAADGSLDTAYDGDGKVFVDFTSGHNDVAGDVALRPGGGLFVGGTTFRPERRIATASLGSDGTQEYVASIFNVDAPFADGVGVAFDAAAFNPAAVLSERHVIVGRGDGDGDDVAIARIGAGLSLHFADVHDYERGLARVQDVVVQPDGRAVAVGRAGSDMRVTRHLATGDLDPSFDSDGILDIDLGSSSDEAMGLAVRSDGRIVVVARRANAINGPLEVLELLSDGAVNVAFGGGDGRVTQLASSPDAELVDVALQADGKVVVAGSAVGGGGRSEFLVARFNADGTLEEPGFGTRRSPLGGASSEAASLAIQPDGKVVVAGTRTAAGEAPQFAVARYNADGTTDNGFGDVGAGYETWSFPGALFGAEARDLALQADGSTVIVGSTQGTCGGGSATAAALARVRDNGLLDADFGDNGTVVDCDASFNVNELGGVTVQPDGMIVAVGGIDGHTTLVARYLGDGTPDPAFGTNGKSTGPAGADATAQHSAVALQADGAILVAGASGGGYALTRYIGGAVTPPAPKPSGAIVFTRFDGNDDEVYSLAPDGTSLRNLTDHPAADGDAAVSPDGQKVLFTTDRGASLRDIWIMNIDGSGAAPIVDHAAYDADPAWSPDGTKFVFASDRSGQFDLWIHDVAAGTETNLTNSALAHDGFPSWSTTGLIAYRSSPGGNEDIYVIPEDGGAAARLTSDPANDSAPAWSPDGARLTFSSNRAPHSGDFEIYAMDANGANQQRITVAPGNDAHPVFSPNGDRIAFEGTRAGGPKLVLAAADGTQEVVLTASSPSTAAPSWLDSIVLLADTPATNASPPAVPLSDLRLQQEAPDVETAPIPNLSLAPIPNLSLAPIPNLSLAPIPNLSLVPIPNLSLAPIPNLSLAPRVADGYDGVLLSSVGFNRPGGWSGFLAGTPLEGAEPAATTFLDLFQQVSLEKLATIHFGELDFSASKLGGVHHSSVLLGRTPLSAIAVPEDGWDWCRVLGELGVLCDAVGDLNASLFDLQVAGVPFDDPERPIPVHATKLSGIALAQDAPLRSIALSDLDLGRLNLGSVTTASLQQPGTVVSCTPGAQGCVTLAEAQDAGFLRSDARFDALLGSDADELSLGELTFGFLPVSANPIGSIDLSDLGVAGYSGPGSTAIAYTARFTAPADGTAGATSLVVDLPRSAAYVPGSAALSIGDAAPLAAEPLLTADLGSLHLAWQVPTGLSPGAVATVSFEARPGLTIGRFTSGARLLSSTVNLVASNRAPVQVGQNHEEGTIIDAGASPISAAPISADTLVLSHISAGDKDFFSFPAPPAGSRIRVDLGHLRADLDLVLYHPADATPTQPLRLPGTDLGTDLAAPEQTSSLSRFGEPVVPEPGQDLDLENLPVAGLGDNRGVVPEVANASSFGSGTYVIQVAGHLGASTDQAYSLRLSVTPPRQLPPCAPRALPSGTSGLWPYAGTFPSTIAAATETLFLVNRDRLADRWGLTEADGVVAELELLRAHPKVQGEILSVDAIPAVRAAYEAWDAEPCDPELANDVVRSINAAVDGALPAEHQLRHVVIVGSSEDLPDAWLPDLTSEGNEQTFLSALPTYAQGNNIQLTGAARGYLRSLDPYGDLNPEAALNGWNYASDLGIGRVGEDPESIVAASQRFLTFDGLLNQDTIDKTLTTGTDFFEDLAAEQDATFERQRAQAPQADLLGAYTADEVRTALGGTTGPGVVALNGHGSPDALEAAAAPGAPLDDRVLRSSEVAGMSAPDRRLVLSIGCHTGFTQPDVLFSSPVSSGALDWSQGFAGQGGLLVGQTGYGIGIRTGVALSEQLMSEVTENLDGSMTIGEALMDAKHRYKGGQLTYGAYDTKVVHEAVLSGLPMYEVKAGGAPPAAPPSGTLGTDERTGLRTRNIVLTPTFFERTVAGEGTYSEGGTGQIVEQNRPLEPKVEVPLPRDAALPAHVAHGVVITGLVSSEREADPVLASLTPGADLPESQTQDVIFPAILQNVTSYESAGGPRQQAVLAAGQFTSTGIVDGKTVGVQRDFVRTEAVAYYSASTDFLKPEFQRVDGSVVGSTVTFSAATTDLFDRTTEGQVVRVVVVYRPKGANTWTSLDLVSDAVGSTTWHGAAAIDTDEVEYFVQAVDAAGNVAVTTRKGAFFLARPVPVLPADLTVTIVSGAAAVDGWYPDASVTLEGAPGEQVAVSVNGGTPEPHVGAIELTGERAHRIDYSTSTSRRGSIVVPVDDTAPRVVIRTPKDGSNFLLGQPVTADYACFDGGVGVMVGSAGCSGTVADGSGIPTSTPGPGSVSVTASDRLGNVSDATTNTYTVGYQFEGFFSPVDNPQVYNVVNGGRAVPVKFRLRAADGTVVSDLASVRSVESFNVECDHPAVSDVVEELVNDLTPGGLTYDAVAKQFVYNWKTNRDWGTQKQCRKLVVELRGGAQRVALFQFK